MHIAAAYSAIILIWSTTPLAIQWSSQSPGHLLSLMARMCLGLFCTLTLQVLLRRPLPWDKKAITTYLYGGLGIYGAMSLVYWSATLIPSSWISILFGLTPLMTSIQSYYLLGEREFTRQKVLSMIIGLFGLCTLLLTSLDIDQSALIGVLLVVLSASIHSGSAVLIKRVNAQLPALACVSGSLLLAVPLLIISWAVMDGQAPVLQVDKALVSIMYLGIVATGGGFSLYYYVLKRISATRMSLIAFVSPVIAIWLGITFNGETLETRTVIGTLFILCSLFLHEFKLPMNNTRYSVFYRKS